MKWAQKFVNATLILKARATNLKTNEILTTSDPEVRMVKTLLDELETVEVVANEFKNEEPQLKNKASACYQYVKTLRVVDNIGLMERGNKDDNTES